MFLRHLWATDGTISVRKPGKKGGHGVHFSTCSRGLADDVAALLLRLGTARKGAGRAFGFVKIRMPPAGQAVANGSEEEQRSFDSTRCKFHRFLRRLPALRAIYPQGLVI